jgi:hypothetical protein
VCLDGLCTRSWVKRLISFFNLQCLRRQYAGLPTPKLRFVIPKLQLSDDQTADLFNPIYVFCLLAISLFFKFLILIKSAHFFYEDGQGEIRDEDGNEAMDWDEPVDPFNIITLMTLSRYKKFNLNIPKRVTDQLDETMEELTEELKAERASGKEYIVYSVKQRAVFYYFNRIKLRKAAPSGRQAGINERTVQAWAKDSKKILNGIYMKRILIR